MNLPDPDDTKAYDEFVEFVEERLPLEEGDPGPQMAEQAWLVAMVAEVEAEAFERAEIAKQKWDETVGDVDIYIRAHPTEFSGEDLKEKAISSHVEVSKEVREARSAWIQAKKKARFLGNLLSALDHRRAMLHDKVYRDLKELGAAAYAGDAAQERRFGKPDD